MKMETCLPNPFRSKRRGLEFEQLSSKLETYHPNPPPPQLPLLRIPNKSQGFDYDKLSSKIDTYHPNPPLPPLRIPKCQGPGYPCGSPPSSSYSYYSAKSSYYSPALDGGWSKKRGYSPDAEIYRRGVADNSAPYDLSDAEKHRRQAEIAVDYYNARNGTSYELVEVILSNVFSANGSWFHLNFTAREEGESLCSVFFAEVFGNITCHSPKMEWVATACTVLGDATVGCSSCTTVFHPTDQGLHKKQKLDTPDSEVQYVTSSPTRKIDALPKQRLYHRPPRKQERVVIPPRPRSEDIRRAKVALKLYNNKYNKDYEFVDVLKAEVKVADGIWYHCNFTAKLPSSDADAAPPMFFAEMEIGSDSLGNLSLGVTACYNLEEGETRIGCFGCSEVIHPLRGFVMGPECRY